MDGFTFEWSTGLGRSVATEEETSRLKAGTDGGRLLLHPELPQLSEFLPGREKENIYTNEKAEGLIWVNFPFDL